MTNPNKIDAIRHEVKTYLAHDSTGHDIYHAMRVAKMGRFIAQEENADPDICEIAGLVHDLGRPMEKEKGVPHWGPEALQQIEMLLEKVGVESQRIKKVLQCVAEHEEYGFLGAAAPESIESRVLQDADRLDALGAIGIARTFMFAGAHAHAMYLPEEGNMNWSPTKLSKDAINHFHEKLFKLADEMHTNTGKKLAGERKRVMEDFLKSFMEEWRGEGYAS